MRLSEIRKQIPLPQSQQIPLGPPVQRTSPQHPPVQMLPPGYRQLHPHHQQIHPVVIPHAAAATQAQQFPGGRPPLPQIPRPPGGSGGGEDFRRYQQK